MPGDTPHGKYLDNDPNNFCYIFVGEELVLAYPMCDDHKDLWWESDAYRTRTSPIPLEEVPLPKPKRRKQLSVDDRARRILKALVSAGVLKADMLPGLYKRGPLPRPTRDYFYQLERQGLIPDEYLLAA